MKPQKSLINEVEFQLKTFRKVLSKPQIIHFVQIIKGMLFSRA